MNTTSDTKYLLRAVKARLFTIKYFVLNLLNWCTVNISVELMITIFLIFRFKVHILKFCFSSVWFLIVIFSFWLALLDAIRYEGTWASTTYCNRCSGCCLQHLLRPISLVHFYTQTLFQLSTFNKFYVKFHGNFVIGLWLRPLLSLLEGSFLRSSPTRSTTARNTLHNRIDSFCLYLCLTSWNSRIQ